VSQELKNSIALHMGHRPETARRMYDRRPSHLRRSMGLAYAAQAVEDLQEDAVEYEKGEEEDDKASEEEEEEDV